MFSRESVASANAALTILATGASAVALALAQFWGANPDHLDRLLIVLFAAYCAWETRPALQALPPKPVRLGYLPLCLGAVAFPVGWFLHAQVGAKPVVLWWLAGAWLLAASGFTLVVGGWGHLRRLAFPLGFVLFALPVPNRILIPLQLNLQSITTTLAAWALPILGVPVERWGFELRLPGGTLGVVEECSGVRSVTALTAIAALVAFSRGFRFARGLLLVLASIPLIAAVNAVRVVISGLLQEYAGQDFVRGHRHEALGIAMILLGLGFILGLARLLGSKQGAPITHADEPQASATPALRAGVGSALLLACAAVATVAGQFLGAGAERELAATAPLEQIPHEIGRWKATNLDVPAEISGMLTPDGILRRVYADLGYEVHVWVIYWSSTNMVKGYHHPDVCWANRDYTLARRERLPIAAGGGTVPVTVREFARGTDRQLVLYWTQEGRRVWSDADEMRVQATGDTHDWLGERLFRREPPAATGRLVVLLGTQVWGDGTAIRTQTLELAAKIADELYRVCPWAAPPE